MFAYFTFPSRKFPLSKVLWGRRNGTVDVVPLLLQKAFEAALFVFVPGGLVSERRPTTCGCSPGWVGAIPGARRHLLCAAQGCAEKTKPKHSARPHASSFPPYLFPFPSSTSPGNSAPPGATHDCAGGRKWLRKPILASGAYPFS